MTIRTHQSFSKFVGSDPKQTRTRHGDVRFYARVGQRHYDSNDDGSYTRLDITYHDLVVYRVAAHHAHEVFREGDSFIAEGHIRTYEYTSDGQTCEPEEFVATNLGHDIAWTTCTIQRPTREIEDEDVATPEDDRPRQSRCAETDSPPTPVTSLRPALQIDRAVG